MSPGQLCSMRVVPRYSFMTQFHLEVALVPEIVAAMRRFFLHVSSNPFSTILGQYNSLLHLLGPIKKCAGNVDQMIIPIPLRWWTMGWESSERWRAQNVGSVDEKDMFQKKKL